MGTRSVTATEVALTIKSTIRNTLGDNQTAQVQLGKIFLSGSIDSGIEADQCNRAWEDRDRALGSGASEDLDLYDFAGIDIGAGAGMDGLGQALTLEEIVTIMIKQTAGPGRLQIMATAPANAITWMPSLTVANGGALKAGGLLLMHNPDADAFNITDASSHMLRLGANGGAVVYDIMVLGRHDDNESSSSTSTSTSTSTSKSTSSTSTSTTSDTSANSSSSTSSMSTSTTTSTTS